MSPTLQKPSAPSSDDPLHGRLAVRPQEAWMIIGCRKTKGWTLVRQGRLEAVRIGGMTVITTRSIRELLNLNQISDAAD